MHLSTCIYNGMAHESISTLIVKILYVYALHALYKTLKNFINTLIRHNWHEAKRIVILVKFGADLI